MVNVLPGQLPSAAEVVGVTEYNAICGKLVGLLSVPPMLVGLPALAAPPVIPHVTVGALQV